MALLEQIVRKQNALLAARKPGDTIHVAVPRGTEPVAPPVAVMLGVQMDLALNARMDALVVRHIAKSKTAAILAALQEYLTQHEFDEAVAYAVRAPTAEGRRVTVGVELDPQLNSRLVAFCKRFTCYKRRAVVAALTSYVEKHREVGR